MRKMKSDSWGSGKEMEGDDNGDKEICFRWKNRGDFIKNDINPNLTPCFFTNWSFNLLIIAKILLNNFF